MPNENSPPEETPRPNPAGGEPGDKGPPPRRQLPPITWLFIVILLVIILSNISSFLANRQSEIPYSYFLQELQADNIGEVEWQGQLLIGNFRDVEKARTNLAAAVAKLPEDVRKNIDATKLKEEFRVYLPPVVGEEFGKLLTTHTRWERSRQPTDSGNMIMLLWLGVSVVIVIVLFVMMRRTRDQIMGAGLFSGFTRSPAKRYEQNSNRITFEDVAGLEGVKSDLQEIVEFLKSPEKFLKLGGHIPKGVLLVGPPGTGKTLLARAVAGEAGVPFFSVNGSEFIQMFVGVGASRVRDLFKTAKDQSPSILFIDEIDAVGRQRGAGLGGGHDEREQTLNQILSEMDGFSQTESVIVLAATNRPDVLDPALLRPGRFDRHVTVDRPSKKGRREIFAVHCRRVPLAEDVDLDKLAASTVGLTGADIRNLVNEAALWAARQNKVIVNMADFEYAWDKVFIGGKREEVLFGKEKTMTAYHEAGHALVAWLLPGSDPVRKVTIIPRGRALGVTQIVPQEDRLHLSESDLRVRLAFTLGGRAAEKLVFDEYTAGTENDLKQATRLARRMVSQWGMSDRIGPIAYALSEEHPFLGREMAYEHREFSDHTARVIDEEVTRIVQTADDAARELLTQHRDQLDKLARALEEREMLGTDEIEALIGPPAQRSGHDMDNPQSGRMIESDVPPPPDPR